MGLSVWLGVSDYVYVGRERQRSNTPIYLSGLEPGCCGTVVRSSFSLSDIESTKYVHLNRLMSGRIEDA